VFLLEVNPLQWGPSKIRFRSTDSLDELLLVIAFIIKHQMEVSGRLNVTFYKTTNG